MSSDDGYYFDERAADTAEAFFGLLYHTKGEWAGRPFVLQPWQRRILRDIIGWKRRRDGLRRYRYLYVEVPRKNGKSTFSAGLALYFLLLDGEPGAEIYSAAADKHQASIVFSEARRMVEMSPVLAEMVERGEIEVYKNSLYVPETQSAYIVLSSDAYTKHGLNAHVCIVDELHAQPNRELWDVLRTSMGARRQPMTIALTTAGYDTTSLGFEEHEYAQRIVSGVFNDPETYAVIYAADPDDPWDSEETWKKANPSYGVTVKPDFLRREARRAKESPEYLNSFQRFYLNRWVQQRDRWLPLEAWDRCEGDFTAEDLEGQPCYGGLDLSQSRDLTAFVLVFPSWREQGGQQREEFYRWLAWFWLPGDDLIERAIMERAPYDVWQREGYLKTTPGNVIDYRVVTRDILALRDRFDIREIAYDPWSAFQMSQDLASEGITMVQFRQGYRSMAMPTSELLRLVKAGQIAHTGNPVLRWMADNMIVRTDPAGNVKPDKSKRRNHIDGIVAGIMALDRAMRHLHSDEEEEESVYESRGILVV